MTKMRTADKILMICALCISAAACVPTRKYDSMRAQVMRYESELDRASKQIDRLDCRGDSLRTVTETLTSDTARLAAQVRQLSARYSKLLADGSAEAARMLRQLEQSQSELARRSERVDELEKMLSAREQNIEALRSLVADALLGFDGKGLTISTKDGKVYVSMDDKLLFRSGSFEIDPRGAKAVGDLAEVLAANPDINVMVEGHTDDVPYRGQGQLKDNLDLSAKRATTVVRLLLENKGIDPVRIIAAGRGESLPVAEGKTEQARAQNRRTEIILTPKMEELYKLIDM